MKRGFDMSIRMKKLSVMVRYAIGVGVAASITGLPAMAQQAEKVEKIEVTGSSVKRIEGESALPITIIKKEDIQKSGVSNTAELLDRVSANSGGAYNVSIGVGDSGQPGFSGVSLRGLGSSSTLILLNGRRLANYAFNGSAVDVNSIPLAVIERVEILKDGASAIYGTDAIGGVINFITRKDFTGLEMAAFASQTEFGGADTTKLTVTGGYGDLAKEGYNLFASWDYDDSTALPGRLRPYARTGIRPDLGFSKTSGNVIPANIRGAGVVDKNGNPILANPSAATGCRPDLGSIQNDNATGTPDRNANFCRYDFTSALDIFPPTTRRSFVTRGTLQLNPQNQVSAEYILVKNITKFASSETPVADFSGNGPFQYPAGGPFYPTSFKLPDGTVVTPTGPLNIAWRAKDAGLRTNEAHSDTQRIVLALDGSAGTIDYKAGLSHNENEATDKYVDGWLSEQRLRAALLTGLVNPFGSPQTAAGQIELNKAKILEDVRKSKATTDTADAKMSTELMQLSSGALALAAGVELRKEKLDDQPQPILFSGDIQGGGGALPPVTADRRVNALFAELNIPIVKSLEVQLQARYDRYSDFGNSTNPKVALRWNPTKEFLMRASYNTGFRAPSLPDLFLPQFKGNTANSFDDPVRCPGGTPQAGGGKPLGAFVDEGLECNAQMINKLGGNPALQPEKSKQFTLGFVIEPLPNASVALDYFAIKKEKTIGALGDSTLFENFAKYDAAGKIHRYARNALGNCSNEDPAGSTPLTPAGVACRIDFVDQFQDNLGDTNTRGIDISIQTRFPTAIGTFTVGLDGTRVLKYEYQREQGGGFFDNNGIWTSDLPGAIAKWKHSLAFGYKNGYWTATAINNYVAGHVDDGGARDVGSFRTWDLQSSWSEAIKGMQLVFGVKNLMNMAPPASVQGNTFQVGYDPRDTDPHGRTFYGSVRYKF
jgi:iron complex outermembrane recepter protein